MNKMRTCGGRESRGVSVGEHAIRVGFDQCLLMRWQMHGEPSMQTAKLGCGLPVDAHQSLKTSDRKAVPHLLREPFGTEKFRRGAVGIVNRFWLQCGGDENSASQRSLNFFCLGKGEAPIARRLLPAFLIGEVDGLSLPDQPPRADPSRRRP